MGDEPDVVEREFMGGHRSKMWTYLILMGLLIVLVVVINAVWNNPSRASEGVKEFFGLPGYALALIMFVAGAIIYWLGLKIETDWPEAFGAFLISGSIVWMELIVGWKRFDLGGLVVLPYLIPIVVFVLLLGYAMKRSA
jgi:uncharacterized integral membrane protein